MKEPDLSIFTPLEIEVLDFAKQWHGDQKRKYTFEPYWHHLTNVAALVKEYGHTEDMVCAALLHDILEDTDCDPDDLSSFLTALETREKMDYPFEFLVMDIVGDLTDLYTKENFPLLNRKQRKEAEARRLGEAVCFSQTVKYCDLIDNTSSIVQHDPEFAKTYLKEKAYMLDCMLQGDKELRRRALLQVTLHHH